MMEFLESIINQPTNRPGSQDAIASKIGIAFDLLTSSMGGPIDIMCG